MKKREQTGISIMKLLKIIKLRRSKYYDWLRRLGIATRHNSHQPRERCITPDEKKLIIEYVSKLVNKNNRYINLGYRRLTYLMMDQDIVCVSPSTVYHVLREAGLLNRWNTQKKNKKGTGYKQPEKPHEEWHTDIKYVNFKGVFLFLITVLDGYSRYIVHHELRINMTEYDVEITIQRALEKYPFAKPKIISDNGTQYVSKDFQNFLKEAGLEHIRTSLKYPQSNGKIERLHRSIGEECLSVNSMIDLDDARSVIDKYVKFYNNERLHSSLNYLTPNDYLTGQYQLKLKEREKKIKAAALARKTYWSNIKVI